MHLCVSMRRQCFQVIGLSWSIRKYYEYFTPSPFCSGLPLVACYCARELLLEGMEVTAAIPSSSMESAKRLFEDKRFVPDGEYVCPPNEAWHETHHTIWCRPKQCNYLRVDWYPRDNNLTASLWANGRWSTALHAQSTFLIVVLQLQASQVGYMLKWHALNWH